MPASPSSCQILLGARKGRQREHSGVRGILALLLISCLTLGQLPGPLPLCPYLWNGDLALATS